MKALKARRGATAHAKCQVDSGCSSPQSSQRPQPPPEGPLATERVPVTLTPSVPGDSLRSTHSCTAGPVFLSTNPSCPAAPQAPALPSLTAVARRVLCAGCCHAPPWLRSPVRHESAVHICHRCVVHCVNTTTYPPPHSGHLDCSQV